MLREQDGPAAIRVVRVATFRLLFPDCCRSNPRGSDCYLQIAPEISRTLEQSEGSNLEHSDCSWKLLRFAQHCILFSKVLLYLFANIAFHHGFIASRFGHRNNTIVKEQCEQTIAVSKKAIFAT